MAGKLVGRKNKFTEEEKTKAIELYKSGRSFRECSEETGICREYISILFKKLGNTPRPSGFQKGNSNGPKTHSEISKKKMSDALFRRWSTHKVDLVGRVFYNYIRGAELRNHVFFLTREQFEKLINGNCEYCSSPPKSRKMDYGKNNWLYYNGIDRVDNTAGYTIENCVSCCDVCNRMKSNMDKDVFISHCKKISLFCGQNQK